MPTATHPARWAALGAAVALTSVGAVSIAKADDRGPTVDEVVVSTPCQRGVRIELVEIATRRSAGNLTAWEPGTYRIDVRVVRAETELRAGVVHRRLDEFPLNAAGALLLPHAACPAVGPGGAAGPLGRF